MKILTQHNQNIIQNVFFVLTSFTEGARRWLLPFRTKNSLVNRQTCPVYVDYDGNKDGKYVQYMSRMTVTTMIEQVALRSNSLALLVSVLI